MRYSFVLATLAASAIATPYINVEVSEPSEVVADQNRNHHDNNKNHHGLKRHHRGDRDDRDDGDNDSWFSIFWRKDRNDKDRHGRHGRDRKGRGRNGRGRDGRGRDNDRDDNDDFHTSDLMDGLFGSDYECVIQATSDQKERKDARECCREVGGELYDVAGRCVFRDVYENPRDEWRTCAIEQSGAVFADCYYREQREVDDELNNREGRNHHKKNHRDHHGRDNKDRNGRDRNDDDHQTVLNDDDQPTECKLDLNNQSIERYIIQRCCQRHRLHGRPTHDSQRCELYDEESVMQFEHCVQSRGVPRSEIECSPVDESIQNHNDFECKINIDDDGFERELTRECCQKDYVHGDLTHDDQRCELRHNHNVEVFKWCINREVDLPEETVQCKRINNREEF